MPYTTSNRMPHRLLSVILLKVFFTSSCGYAITPTPEVNESAIQASTTNEQTGESTLKANLKTDTSVNRKRIFKLRSGVHVAQFIYKEPNLMKEYGLLKGIALAFERPFGDADQSFIGEVEYLQGGLVYDGAYMNGTPVKSRTSDRIWSAHTLITTPTQWKFGGFAAQSLLGVGYRSLNDKIHGKGGYEREIQYVYLPVGARLSREYGSRWGVDFTFVYNLFVDGRVKSHLSDVASELPDVVNRQSSGYGIQLSTTITYKFPILSAQIRPFLQYWDIQDSEQKYGFYEPMNNSTLTGTQIAISF